MPRFLGHYTRDLKLMDLSQAVRKITSLPAQREHLSGRGLLKSGFYADVTVFDPAAILDTATYTEPDQVSKGVEYVLVNGQLEWDRGKLTGATGGRALIHESGVHESDSNTKSLIFDLKNLDGLGAGKLDRHTPHPVVFGECAELLVCDYGVHLESPVWYKR
jgi:formylmethanofuran dehydrogenase subunit A